MSFFSKYDYQQYIQEFIINKFLNSKKIINEIKENIDKTEDIDNITKLNSYYNDLNLSFKDLYIYLNQVIDKRTGAHIIDEFFNVFYKDYRPTYYTSKIDKTKKYICLRYFDIYPLKIYFPKIKENIDEDIEKKEIKKELNENIDVIKIDDNIYYNASIIKHNDFNYIASQCPFTSFYKDEDINIDDISKVLNYYIDKEIYDKRYNLNYTLNYLNKHIRKGEKDEEIISYGIEIIDNNTKKKHLIKILHYDNWENENVPDDKDLFMKYIYRIFRYIKKYNLKNILTHCSAGVGRTGTVFCCVELLRYINDNYFDFETKSIINEEFNLSNKTKILKNLYKYLFDFIFKLRLSRQSMVQKVIQFQTIIEFINNIIDKCLSNYSFSQLQQQQEFINDKLIFQFIEQQIKQQQKQQQIKQIQQQKQQQKKEQKEEQNEEQILYPFRIKYHYPKIQQQKIQQQKRKQQEEQKKQNPLTTATDKYTSTEEQEEEQKKQEKQKPLILHNNPFIDRLSIDNLSTFDKYKIYEQFEKRKQKRLSHKPEQPKPKPLPIYDYRNYFPH